MAKSVFGSRVDAVIFDIGDTLLDATGIEGASLRATARFLALPDEGRRFIASYGETAGDWQSPEMNRLFGLPVEMFVDAWEGAGLGDRDPHEAFRLYQSCVRWRIGMAPELVDVFHALKERGYKVGIASDGTTPEQIETLRRLGVWIYVDAIVVSDIVGASKPSPKMFRAVQEELGIDASAAVYVGDSLERDVRGAGRAGMQSVYVIGDEAEVSGMRGVPAVPPGQLHRILDMLPERAGRD
jgi:putative hydrolase of the HAD superfamily